MNVVWKFLRMSRREVSIIGRFVKVTVLILRGLVARFGGWLKSQNEQALSIRQAIERSKDRYLTTNPWPIRGGW